MFIKAQKKWRKSADGLVMVPYTYYRLCESFRSESGHVRQRMIFGLGELKALHNESERKELARLLDGMKRDLITINWKSMNASMPRSIGTEHICLDMLRRLDIDRYLLSLGWSR